MTSSISALSRTVRARPPYTLRPSHPWRPGAIDTRPRVAFIPTRPHAAAGIRIEPPPSDPVAHGTSPAATAAADPPEDPPGVRVTSHGLRVTPFASVAVHGKIVSSGTFVIPIGIAPAARRRRTASASAERRRPVAPGAARRRLALDGQIVLDRDRHAGERTAQRGVSRGERLVGHRHAERIQTRVQFLDPAQAQLDELARLDFVGSDQLRECGGSGEGEIDVGGRGHGA